MFEKALDIVLRHEGGYVNHPQDPGGETNFGVTKRVAQAAGYDGDMRSIPMDLVRSIYRERYWDKVRGDALSWPVAMVTFDAAVNSGVHRASQWLQRACGSAPDGVIGPMTISAVSAKNPREIARDVCSIRLGFLQTLKTWPTFGRGWSRRVQETLQHALED